MLIPLEITAEILARLPVRCVLQLRSVCKIWREMIDDQVFAASHLEREIASGKRGPTSFFLRTDQFDDVLEMYLVEQQQEHVHMFKATKIPLSLPEAITFDKAMSVNSARGLFAICYYGPYGTQGKDIFHNFICNPFTGQYSKLPVILSQRFNEGVISGGFGYNPSTGEFKVVRIFRSWITREIEVLVFRLGSKSWKKLENLPFEKCPHYHSVSIDNLVHWFSRTIGLLLIFDIASETFGSIQLPESRSAPYPGYLYNLDGCLSIADSSLDDRIEVWVMKDYGATESWTRLVIAKGNFELGDYVFGFQPVAVLSNIEILLLCNAKTLEVHNTETGTRTPVHICGLPGCPRFAAYSYGGNLLSLRPAV